MDDTNIWAIDLEFDASAFGVNGEIKQNAQMGDSINVENENAHMASTSQSTSDSVVDPKQSDIVAEESIRLPERLYITRNGRVRVRAARINICDFNFGQKS